jgi:hypothetical protein
MLWPMPRAMPLFLVVAVGLLGPAAGAQAQYGEGAGGLAAPAPDDGRRVPPPPPPDGYRGPDAAHKAPPDTAAAPQRADAGVAIPGPIATRLRTLDVNLSMLARRSSGVVDGILSLLVGGLSITMGAIINDGGAERQRFARYLYLWGSGQVARGILSFALPLRADDIAIEYQHMPMGTEDEVRDRLLFGEDALERLARRARVSRLLNATINTSVGLLAIPLYLAPADFEMRTGNDYLVVIASGISVVTGVINFILKSEAERRWTAYTRLRDRLDEQAGAVDEEPPPTQARGPRWDVGGAPMRGGFVGTVGAVF